MAGADGVRNPQAWACLEEDSGEIQEAQRLFQHAVESDPYHVPAWQVSAHSWLQLLTPFLHNLSNSILCAHLSGVGSCWQPGPCIGG